MPVIGLSPHMMFLQFLISVAIGYLVFETHAGASYQANLMGSVFVGIAGTYFLMKLYVLIRYGRKAARSFKWFGN